ncbi:MAG: hypothetical protein ACE15F_17860 [bacterium]
MKPVFDQTPWKTEISLICPTCKVAFSNQANCRRCGSDLSLLMRAATRAWELREAARRGLLQGRFVEAWKHARQAQAVQRTPRGERLEAYARHAMKFHAPAQPPLGNMPE